MEIPPGRLSAQPRWDGQPVAPLVGALAWLLLAYAAVAVVDVAGVGSERLEAARPP